MQQILATFGVDWHLIVVQFVNFGVLIGVLWYIFHKPIITLIESRRAQIIEGVANAERAAMALKDSDAKKADILSKASLEADALIARARDAAKQKEALILKEAQEKYERALTEARLKGEEIERSALAKSRDEVARLIVLGVEKTLQQKTFSQSNQ